MTFGETFAHRVAQAWVRTELFYPEICARVYSCEMLEDAMAAAVTEASCTVHDSGDCTCVATQITEIDDRDAYTTEDDQIVSSTSGKRWDYCIEGDPLRYRDTGEVEPREPGIIELARR